MHHVSKLLLVSAACFLGCADDGGYCDSTQARGSTTVLVNGVSWTDPDSLNGSGEEDVFIFAQDPNGEDSLSMIVPRLAAGSYPIASTVSEFTFANADRYYTELTGGLLVVSESDPGAIDECNGTLEFTFEFTATELGGTEPVSASGDASVDRILGATSPANPPGDGGGGSVASCTDPNGVCTQLNSGDAAAYQTECEAGGNQYSSSACAPGAFQCLDATGTSAGASVAIEVHWPADICSVAAYTDTVYLQGTCENILSGSYSGAPDSCCTGTTTPGPDGTFCG
jgi:hypothetical protein